VILRERPGVAAAYHLWEGGVLMNPTRPAFNFVELLVALGVIALLAVLLAHTVQKVFAAGGRAHAMTVCVGGPSNV
jgi:prepilin-type N-terminal cleavage/methylation domain-containing protein